MSNSIPEKLYIEQDGATWLVRKQFTDFATTMDQTHASARGAGLMALRLARGYGKRVAVEVPAEYFTTVQMAAQIEGL